MATRVQSAADQIKAAVKRGDKSISAGDGLRLRQLPSGNYAWQYNYLFGDKQKTISYGSYPLTSLALAEERHRQARDNLYNRLDPMLIREQERSAKSAAQVAALNASVSLNEVIEKWLGDKKQNWSQRSFNQASQSLRDHVSPLVGHLPISSITTATIYPVFKKLEDERKFETCRRVFQRLVRIFNWAIIHHYYQQPTSPVPVLKEELAPVPKPKSMPTVKLRELTKLLNDVEAYDGYHSGDVTRLALLFMCLAFTRTTEMIKASWDEIDFDDALWSVADERMKIKHPELSEEDSVHLVPLSRQAIEILRQLKELAGNSPWVFASPINPGSHISNNTMLFALYRMGYAKRMSGHGYRGLASTVLNSWGFHKDWVETQLAHCEKDDSRSPYNKAKYLAQRRVMLQWWADHVDRVREGASAIPDVDDQIDRTDLWRTAFQ